MAPQTKRRKVESAVEEINFDPTARHDYLTGFHKRKVQRIKQAQEYAQKKAREERIEQRKKVFTCYGVFFFWLVYKLTILVFQSLQIREQRAAEVEQAINESRKMLEQARGGFSSSESGSEDEEWDGFEDPVPVDYEEEYIDEDKYTTVTVEEMGLSRNELQRPEEGDASSADDQTDRKEKENVKSEVGVKVKRKQNNQKKRKKFRYESKEDRKVAQRKQKLGSRKKASARRDR